MDRILKQIPKNRIFYNEDNQVIICGDCLEILPLLSENSVDLVLTDPPYMVNKFETDYIFDVNKMLNLIFENLKEDGRGLIFWNSLDIPTIQNNLNGFNLLNICIWNPTNPTTTYDSKRYAFCYQPIFHICKGSPIKIIKPIRDDYHREKEVFNTPTLIFNQKTHPVEKPINLIKQLIRNITEENDIILDPFLGSGTTLVACQELGRKGIGIEIEEKYCEIAVKRLRQRMLL